MQVGTLLHFLSILVDALQQEQLDVFTLRLIEKLDRKKHVCFFHLHHNMVTFQKVLRGFFFSYCELYVSSLNLSDLETRYFHLEVSS